MPIGEKEDRVGVTQVVVLQNVTKQYGRGVVVDNLSLNVGAGEIVALLGQTGAGKSTILNMVMGHVGPTSGEVRVEGIDPLKNGNMLRGRIAVSFQTDRLLPWRTAEQNVMLGMEYLGLRKAERSSRARAWLNRVNLDEVHHHKFPHQLSGGMRQRVSLARAMGINPELILLDESFSQLDHVTSKALRGDFVALVKDFKKTCMLITHRIDDAIEMADRIIVLGAPAHIKYELAIDRKNFDPASLGRARDLIAKEMSKAAGVDEN
jgi:NitT/TauT family transport system ATP-binding protein